MVLISKTTEAIRYRVGQFMRALVAPRLVSQEKIEQATQVLTPEAQILFHRQTIQDQIHALAVHDALCRSGYTDPNLLAAALLHDVGKASAWLPPWRRAIFVLLERFAPRLWARLIEREPRGWQRALVIYAHHPEVGARWTEQAGCSSLTVALIRRHQEELMAPYTEKLTEEDRLLALLQAADKAN